MINSIDDTEWHECLDWNEDGGVLVHCEDSIFLTVPSKDEVDDAVSSIQQAFKLSSYFSRQSSKKLTGDSETDGVDWIDHHSVTISSSSRILQQRNGSNNSVYDAFHLLQTDTSVQRAVVSLSHDQTVWDAVLKNKDVKKLMRGSTFRAIEQGDDNNNNNIDSGTSDDSNPVKDIMSFVFPKDDGKNVPLINKIARSVNDDFQLPSGSSMGERNGGFMKEENNGDKKLKTSLFLTIIVMLVVIIKRFWHLRG